MAALLSRRGYTREPTQGWVRQAAARWRLRAGPWVGPVAGERATLYPAATSRRIYYRGGGKFVAVAFDPSGPEPTLGKPVSLFDDAYDFGQALSLPNYDVGRDGRFLMLRRGGQSGTLRVVLNWTEELKRTIANGGAR